MEKSLEEQIKEQEKVVKQKSLATNHFAIYSVDSITKEAEYNAALVKLLELKLQFADKKSKGLYCTWDKTQVCNIQGCDPKCIKNEPEQPKEKTLEDYRSEYFSIRYNLSNSKTEACLINSQSFEFSCGLLKYICKEIDKEFGASETNSSIVLNRYIGEYQVWTTINSPFTAHHDALHKVIKICGAEFLDKIFKA